MTTYLDLEDLLHLVRALGAGPVRDPGLLESAAARPRTTLFGEDAYPGLPLKAAALMHSLTRNHALVDGNMRLSWLAATVFLGLNGFDVEMPDDDAYDFVVSVAEGAIDVSEIAEVLERALAPRT